MVLPLPFILAALCNPVSMQAQDDSQIRAIMILVGVSEAEELDEAEIERFLHYASHPLEVNLAGKRRLVSSGLLSRYQAASLEDYRSRNGDVLSFSELSSVEGFGAGYVSALKPFISLRSSGIPGDIPTDSLVARQEALARCSVRKDGYAYGAKYRLQVSDLYGMSASMKKAYPDPVSFPPSSWSLNAWYHGRGCLSQVVAGDYNLRFGQGLSLWSGLSLGGLSSYSSFCRRPTGLSPSYSMAGTGSHRGVAAELDFGAFTLVPFMALPGLKDICEGRRGKVSPMSGANLTWSGKDGQASLTAYGKASGGKLSVDARWNRRGVDIFGEAAMSMPAAVPAFVAGVSMLLGGEWRLSSVSRFYPSGFDPEYSGSVRSWTRANDERGIAAGLEGYGMQCTVDFAVKDSDASRRQAKLLVKVPVQLAPVAVLSLRFSERFRPYEEYLKYKTGLRLDVDICSSGLSARYGEKEGNAWKGRIRLEGLLCRSLSGLSYVELGRKTEDLSAYIRGTVFLVDNWDDRIYSYERDAPGCFNVPAYYGRGYSLSAAGGFRKRFGRRKGKTLRTYLRVSAIDYPFMHEPRPARFEARLQLMCSI